MKKKILLIGGGTTLLLLCMLFGALFAGPLLASAQSTTNVITTNTTTNPACQQYLQDLAHRLNVPVSTFEQDRLAAREDVLNQEVKAGKLTQAQANTIEKRLQSQQACSGNGTKLPFLRNILRQTLKQSEPMLISQIAQGLKIGTSQLQSDLLAGQTLNQIAKAQGTTQSQLHTIVLNAAQNTLNQAQKAGTITQQQDSGFLQFLRNHPGLVNRWLNHKFMK
jgi:hypothetical protein